MFYILFIQILSTFRSILPEMSSTIKPRRRFYGFTTFVLSTVFAVSAIGYVFWSESVQKQRRRRGVEQRLHKQQHQANMDEYLGRQERYKQLTEAATSAVKE